MDSLNPFISDKEFEKQNTIWADQKCMDVLFISLDFCKPLKCSPIIDRPSIVKRKEEIPKSGDGTKRKSIEYFRQRDEVLVINFEYYNDTGKRFNAA